MQNWGNIIKENSIKHMLGAIGIHLITFFWAFVYFRYLYLNYEILAVSGASGYLQEITLQSILVNLPIILIFIAVLMKGRKRAADNFHLMVEGKKTVLIVSILVVVYLAMLIRQIVVYDDMSGIIFKWLYYFIFVAFMEELEYRAVIPALLKGHVNSKLEWILPNVLFACAHILMPIVQEKAAGEVLGILLSSILGYVLAGMFFEGCKRVGGSLWVSVLVHALMDFGI